MRMVLMALGLMLSCALHAQPEGLKVRFAITYGGAPLELGKPVWDPDLGDSLTIDILRFYVGQFALGEAEVLPGYHLVDLEDPASLTLELPEPAAPGAGDLSFSLGVDSLTSVSGAMAGDLDPMHGMYWAWQSGYINFKLEGHTPRCPARKNRFQYHLGGYQHPWNSHRRVELSIKDRREVIIEISIDKLLKTIDLVNDYKVMSPGAPGLQLTDHLVKIIRVLP